MDSFSTKLVRVGNSKGIILPKKALNKLGVSNDEIEIEVTEEAIVLKPSRKKNRRGWEKAFKKMHKGGDDKQVIPDFFDNESLNDWKW